MSPITTLLPAACAPVAASDANSSHGMVRVPIVFFILSASLVFCRGGKLESRGAGSNWPFVAVFCGIRPARGQAAGLGPDLTPNAVIRIASPDRTAPAQNVAVGP